MKLEDNFDWESFVNKYVRVSYENGEFQSIGIVSNISDNFVNYHCLFQVKNGWNNFLEISDSKDKISDIQICSILDKEKINKILLEKYNYIFDSQNNTLAVPSKVKIDKFIHMYGKLIKEWNNLTSAEKEQCKEYEIMQTNFIDLYI